MDLFYKLFLVKLKNKTSMVHELNSGYGLGTSDLQRRGVEGMRDCTTCIFEAKQRP